MKSLQERLRIKANMIDLGEKIAWGSDTDIMHEAADKLDFLQSKCSRAMVLLTKYCPKNHHDWEEVLQLHRRIK